MKNLPIEVSEDEIEDMFAAVDKNKDDKISYREFQKMINPPDIPQAAKPYVSQIGLKPQLFSPPSGKANNLKTRTLLLRVKHEPDDSFFVLMTTSNLNLSIFGKCFFIV